MADLALDSWNLNHSASIVLEIQIKITTTRAIIAGRISFSRHLAINAFRNL